MFVKIIYENLVIMKIICKAVVMNFIRLNYTDDDYSDKSDSDIRVPRNQDYTLGILVIPKKTIDLYKISNTKMINNMHTT